MQEKEGKPNDKHQIHRRKFVEQTAAATGFMILNSNLVRGTAANSALQLGVIGCGGRARSVGHGFLKNTATRVHALADVFQDQLDRYADGVNKVYAEKGTGPIDRSLLFKGPDAFRKLANSSQVDVVLITSPPYYHPEHLQAVVDAGKHAYCEKPVAVDVAGCRHVMKVARQAEGRLSLDVGFQIRSAPPFIELTRRIHNGALGRIGSGLAYYYAGALKKPDYPNASPLERRLRHWFFDRTLSGDIIVEQNVHVIDVCNWVLQGHPIKASGSGGRKVVHNSGNCYDHFNVTYTYPNDVVITFASTKYLQGWFDVCERFFGSKGVSEAHYSEPVAIYGEEPWDYFKELASQMKKEDSEFSDTGDFGGALADSDSEKQKGFEASIRSGSYHNQGAQGAQGAESALSAILGREAAYTGETVNWYELLQSNQHWEAGVDLTRL